jgi:ADP-ribose pyrophosphatase YjhB (NUDIX family)
MVAAMSAASPVCPHCADPDEQPIVCDRCGWRWHANPKPAAAVILERSTADGAVEILLLRRAVEPGAGAWDLPAGYLDPGESFEQGALRETREEAGIGVELVELTGVYHSPPANAVTAVFRARALHSGDRVETDHESSDHAWIRLEDVPAWLPRLAFPSMASAVRDWSLRAR